MLVLEHNYWVILQVSHADGLSFFDDLWMLSDNKPPHVGEEEPSVSIVRITRSLATLVVGPVITGPDIDRVLASHRVCY